MTTMTAVAMGGLGVLTVAWVAVISFRQASASLRHSIWLAALLGLLTIPVLEVAGVRVEVPVPTGLSLPLPAWAVDDAPASTAPAASMTATPRTVAHRGVRPEAVATWGQGGATVAAASGQGASLSSAIDGSVSGRGSSWGGQGRGIDEPAPLAVASVGDRETARGVGLAGMGDGVRSPLAGNPVVPAVGDVASVLGSVTSVYGAFAVWLVVAMLLLCVTAFGHLRARRLTISDVETPSPVALQRLDGARLALGVRRPVSLVVSRRIRVPATWGFLRPVIVLPEAYRQWSEATLDRVLLHELAHIARRDCEAYLVGDLARALHWFNPLVWVASRRLRAESERACDDRVLEVVRHPSDYAADLVAMVRGVSGSAGVPRAALAMAQPRGVSDRVRAILDPSRSRARVRTPAAVTIGAVAMGLVLSATVVTPAPVTLASDAETPDAESPRAETAADKPGVDVTARAIEPTTVTAPARTSVATLPSVGVDLGAAHVSPAAETARPQERLCIFREGGSRSTSHHQDEDEIRIRWETDDCRVDIDILGRVDFADDDRSVVALASDARFEIEERFGNDERRARIEGRSGGGMERRFWLDGEETPWGPEADRWLASILPEIFRHSTINAEARVRRMVDEGGADAVFAEAARIQSDHVSRRYLELLMEATELDEAGYRRVIEAAAAIESDHGSAELLLAVVRRAGLRTSFQDPLLAASEGLDSDHQRTRVLRVLLDSPLSGAQLDAVLRSAQSIDSDHNLGELLSSIAAAGRMDDVARASFLETLRSMASDHQQAMVMHAFLDSGRLSDAELAMVLELTDNLESDHQRADVLQRVARDYPLSGDQVSAYLRSAAGMESDHQKASTARVITERADFNREQMLLVLRMADQVDSDHQQGEILGSVLRRRSLDAAEMSELLRVAGTIDSSHQLGMVVGVLVEEQDLGDATLLELLDVIGTIDSSHQKAESLLRVARRYDLSGAARDRYTELARGVGSHDRERLMAALSG